MVDLKSHFFFYLFIKSSCDQKHANLSSMKRVNTVAAVLSVDKVKTQNWVQNGYSWKLLIIMKKIQLMTKDMQNYLACKELNNLQMTKCMQCNRVCRELNGICQG